MKEKLFESINAASYLLWEYTKSDNALGLWCCSEDIASMFEQKGITSRKALDEIINLDVGDSEYISFMRDISYKVYSYTGNLDHIKNWFLSEGLLENEEWKNAVVCAASIYSSIRGEDDVIKSIRSESVRNFYTH